MYRGSLSAMELERGVIGTFLMVKVVVERLESASTRGTGASPPPSSCSRPLAMAGTSSGMDPSMTTLAARCRLIFLHLSVIADWCCMWLNREAVFAFAISYMIHTMVLSYGLLISRSYSPEGTDRSNIPGTK